MDLVASGFYEIKIFVLVQISTEMKWFLSVHRLYILDPSRKYITMDSSSDGFDSVTF